MFTDSGICWVLCSVSAFTFRWFPLQGGEEHWLSGYAVRSKTTEYLLKSGRLVFDPAESKKIGFIHF